MCSIVGAAGPIHKLSSKRRQEFHEFLSVLFTMAELRGRDASGFWVWRNDHYVFEKRPIPAEDLIQRSPRWKSLRFNPGSLYLLHTRAATDGDPNDNVNNHPHIGEHSVMIHNGMLWSHQGLVTKHNLQMRTDCDSEVILRLVEQHEEMEDGLEKMYDATNKHSGTCSIATAFIDRREPDKIFLSRNSGNPCYVYRSERFNCTFFVSTEDIFEKALESMYGTKTPDVIDAKSEDVQIGYLYELSEDGTYNKKFLYDFSSSFYTSTSTNTGYNNRQYNYDDDDYIEGMLCGTTKCSVEIDGSMTLYDTKGLPEEDVEEIVFEEDEIEFEEFPKMPVEVEESLKIYLEEKVKELS